MSRETPTPSVVRFGDAVWYGPLTHGVFLAANPDTGLSVWRTWPYFNASVLEWRYEVRTQSGDRVDSFADFGQANAIAFPLDATPEVGGPRAVQAEAAA